MAKRVLWLSNNTEQREYEVTRLLSAGYEVFCPKKCGYGLGENFLSVSYNCDHVFSIEPKILEKLNDTDLYSDAIVDLMEEINDLFDIIFAPPAAELLRRLAHHFRGVIVLRWTGDEEGLTCTERIIKNGGYNIFYLINRIKERFYFAYSLPSDIEDECDILRGRALYMPIPIVPNERELSDRTGCGILMCPNTAIDDTAKMKMLSFIGKGDILYKICGTQLVPPENDIESYIGNDLDHEKSTLKEASVAVDFGLCSSLLTEPWKKALSYGIPLLYVRKSVAFNIFGKKTAGYCKDEKEQRKKYEAIVKGHSALGKKILIQQERILESYTEDYCNNRWNSALSVILRDEDSLRFTDKMRKKRVCILLTDMGSKDVLEFSKNFAFSLQEEVQKHGKNAELVFAYIKEDGCNHRGDFEGLEEKGILVREVTTKKMKRNASMAMLEIGGFLPVKWHGAEIVPNGIMYDDGIHMLMDCDYIIFMTDESGGGWSAHPLYPYAVAVKDYEQRYTVENRNKTVIPMARNADKVFVFDGQTYSDALQYAMVKKENLVMLPALIKDSSRELYEQVNRAIGLDVRIQV